MQIIVACRGKRNRGEEISWGSEFKDRETAAGACRTSSTMAPPLRVSPPLSGEGLRWFAEQDRNFTRSRRDGCVRPYLESEATGVDWIPSPNPVLEPDLACATGGRRIANL